MIAPGEQRTDGTRPSTWVNMKRKISSFRGDPFVQMPWHIKKKTTRNADTKIRGRDPFPEFGQHHLCSARLWVPSICGSIVLLTKTVYRPIFGIYLILSNTVSSIVSFFCNNYVADYSCKEEFRNFVAVFKRRLVRHTQVSKGFLLMGPFSVLFPTLHFCLLWSLCICLFLNEELKPTYCCSKCAINLYLNLFSPCRGQKQKTFATHDLCKKLYGRNLENDLRFTFQ